MGIQTSLIIIGGFGLFLYGMHLVGDSLHKLSHNLLKTMVEALAGGRIPSALAGAAAAVIIQSYTATSVTVAGALNAGIIRLSAALAVMLGANLGITITAHILATNLMDVAPFFVFIGALYYFFTPKTRNKNRGIALFAFGLLFIGLSMMSEGMGELAGEKGVIDFLRPLETSPFLMVITGIMATVLLKGSANAAIGLIIAVALGGMIDLQASLYFVFGANVGGCLIGLVEGRGTNPANRRLVLGNVLFNFGGLLLALAMVSLYLARLPLISESLPRQIALAHTAFNLVLLVVFLPLIPVIVKFLERVVPGEIDMKQEIRYLNENFISTPYLAIMAVTRELTVMLSLCMGMLDKAEACIVAYNHKLKNEIIFDEESVDEMQKNITNYLVEITRNELTDRERRLIPALLHSVNDLEKIADYCEDIVKLAQRVFEENLSFSGAAGEELERLFAKTRTMMKYTYRAIDENDAKAAQLTLTIKKEIDELIAQYKLNHVKRLESGTCTNEPGLVFSDILTDIEHINDHLLNITKGILHIGKR